MMLTAKGSSVRTALRYLVLAVFVVGALFPLYWVFVSSVKPNADVFKIPPTWTFRPSLGNYRQILGMTSSSAGGTDFVRYAINSTIIAIGTAIPSLLLGTLAAYGITRCRVRWGGRYLSGILVGRLVPPAALLVPLFVLFTTLHLIDTQIAVIITLMCFGLPFVIWMMSGFFSELPYELDEAALVDGCSRIGSLFRVILPISVSGLVVTGFFVVLGGWNEFLIPLVLTENNAQPIAVAIQSYVAGFNVHGARCLPLVRWRFSPYLSWVGSLNGTWHAGLPRGR